MKSQLSRLVWLGCLLASSSLIGCKDDKPSDDHSSHTPTAGTGGMGGQTAGTGGMGGVVASDAGDDAALTPLGPDASVPTLQLRGKVQGVAADAQTSIVVSANGVSVAAGRSGVFVLDAPLSKAPLVVTARAPGYSTAALSLPASTAKSRNVLLMLTPMIRVDLEKPEQAQNPWLGEDMNAGFLQLPKDALRTVYETAPVGTVTLSSLTLHPSAAVGGGWIEEAGKRRLFSVLGGVEVHIVQNTSALTLKKKAKLTLPAALAVAEVDAGVAAVTTLQVARLDEAAGVFRPYVMAPYDAETTSVTFEIDDFGVYVMVGDLGETACATVHVNDAKGAPLAHAALLYGAERLGSEVWTDESGGVCLPSPVGANLFFGVFGATDAGFFEIPYMDATVLPIEASSCGGTTCTDFGVLVATALPLSCARGHLENLSPSVRALTLVLSKKDAAEEELPIYESVPVDSDFCVDTSGFQKGVLSNIGTITCGKDIDLSAASQAAACGSDGCLDLGTIKCCDELDYCNDNFDGDCDGKIDEGCACGGADCEGAHFSSTSRKGYCCTADDVCGLRGESADKCFQIQTQYIAHDACPTETLPSLATPERGGCCLYDMRCGISDDGFGCIPREDAQAVLGLPSALGAMACELPFLGP